VEENHGGGNSLKGSTNRSTRIARLQLCIGLVLAAGFASPVQAGQSAPGASTPRAVSALGRLEPQGGIVEISASSIPDALQGGVLAQLFVEVGDDVEIGQLLAITDTADVLRAKVEEARTVLALVQQQAAASRSSADATCVRAGVLQREADRLSTLRQQDLAAEEETDRAIGEAEAAAADCTAARSAVLVAEADISVARARLSRQEKEFARSQIVSPSAGKVLVINARPGERIDSEGILELGNVAQMYAIAEVYETDVSRLRLGQQATVSSAALPGELSGRIERIRPIVRKQDQIGTDPAARKDARIIEVEILLDSAEAAAAFTNLQVDVVFQP
jgi:HlyD family secretion protein